MTLYGRQWQRPSQEKKCKKAKRLSKEGLQIAEKKKKNQEAKSKEEKERYVSECRVPKNSKER